MPNDVGIFFSADSFKEFNSALEKFNQISRQTTLSLTQLANAIKPIDNNILKGVVTNLEKFQKVAKSIDKSNLTKTEDFFKNMLKLSKGYAKISFGKSDSLGLMAESLQKMYSTMQTIGKKSIDTTAIVANFDSFKLIFDRFTKSTARFSNNSIINSINKIGSIRIDNFTLFIKGLSSAIYSLKQLNNVTIDTASIDKSLTAIKTIITTFTGINRGLIGNILHGIKNLFSGGKGSLIDIINKVGEVKLDNFANFSSSLSKLALSFNTISSIEINFSNIAKFMEGVRLVIKTFTGSTGLFGNLRNSIKTMFGRDGGIFSLLGNIDANKFNNFGNMAIAIKRFSDSMDIISKVRIDEKRIKEFGIALKFLIHTVKTASGRGNIIEGIFGRNTGKVINEVASGISKLTRSFVDISKIKGAINLDSVVASMGKAGERGAASFIAGIKKKLQIRSPSRVMKEIGEQSAIGYEQGLLGRFKDVGNKIFNTIKNIFTKINPFKQLENGAEQTTNRITGIFGKLKNVFNNLFKNVILDGVLNVNSIIASISRNAFDTLVGSAIKFEDAFVGVQKTLDTSNMSAAEEVEFFKQLDEQLRFMATDSDSVLSGLGNASSTILTIAEAAGSLGIANENLQDFTETVGAMTIATNLSAEAASDFFGQFGAVTGTTEYDRLGSTMVGLGNKFAATESQIAEFSIRLVGAGTSAGFTEAEILGIGAAMASVGINAEAGGSAMTQVFDTITKAVSEGGEDLKIFSKIAGQTSEEFAKTWRDNPVAALEDFVEGFGELDSEKQVKKLDQLGLDGIRTSLVLRLLGNAGDQLSNAIDIANESWDENIALMQEAEKRNQTTQASINRLKNNLFNMQVVLGRYLQPAFKGFIDLLTEGVQKITAFLETPAFQSFADRIGSVFKAIGGFIISINRGILSAIGKLAKNSGALDKFKSVFSLVGKIVDGIVVGLNKITNLINEISGFGTPAGVASQAEGEQAVNDIYSQREAIINRINQLQQFGSTEYKEQIVEAGDTLSEIAANAGISLDDLIEANKDTIKDPNLIFAGQKIKIPFQLGDEETKSEIDKLQKELDALGGGQTGGFQNQVSNSLQVIKGDIIEVRGELPKLREGIAEVFSGDYSSGLQNIRNFFNELGKIISDTINQIFGAEQDSSDLRLEDQYAQRFGGVSYKTNVVENVIKAFNEMFTNIDLTDAASLLLKGLGIAITAVFGVPGALAFGIGKLIAEAIEQDFMGIDTFLREVGVYEAIDFVKQIINDLLGAIGIGPGSETEDFTNMGQSLKQKSATNPILQVFQSFIDGLEPIIETLKTIDLTGLQEGLGILFDGVKEHIDPVLQVATVFIQDFFVPAIENLVESFVEFINSLDPASVNGFVIAMGALFGIFALPTVLALAGSVALLSGISSSIGDFATAVADLFGAFGLILQGDPQGAITKLGDAIEAIWNGVKNFVQGAVQPFIDLINKLLELNGSDFRLMSVEQAFQTLELVIKGVMTAIKLTVDDFFSRFELQVLDFQIRIKDLQIALTEATPEALRDNSALDAMRKERDELLKRQSGINFGFEINEIVSGQMFSGLNLGKLITFDNFDGTQVTKSIEQILADPELVNELSQSTRDLLVNAAEKAFSSGDAEQIADALKIYDLFNIAIPTDLDTDQQLVAKTATAFGELVSAGWGNVNLDQAAYDAIIKPISDAIANEDIMGAVWASNNLYDQTIGAGKDIGAALKQGLVEEFKTEGGSGLIDNFLPLIDFSNPDFQAQFDKQISGIADMYQDPELALQIAQALESQLENAISVGTGEQIDLTIDPEKFNLEFQQKEGIEAFFSAGSDLVNGIVQGLTGGDTDIETGITNFWTLLNDTFKEQAGIESPSTVFAEHGSNMVEGLTEGIVSNQSAIQAVSMLFGGINLIFQQYSENLALATMRTYEVTQAVINGFTIMTEQANLMAIALINLSNQIQSVLMGLANISVGSSLTFQLVAAGTGQQPEGRAMGGDIMSGKVYEVLENGLPFEIFETNGRKYFLSGSDGTMYSPNAGLGTSNTSNYTMGGDTYQIQATFMSEGNNEAVINKLVTDVKEIKKGNKQIGKNARRAGL